jgi:polyferredoxin
MFPRYYLKYVRYAFQWFILLLLVNSGVRLYLFLRQIELGLPVTVHKPPSVEGFLPIGGLVGLRAWLETGFFDPIHPAAVVILALAFLMSLLLKKAFCGWVCPIGTISEATYRLGRRLLKRDFKLPSWLDYPLRSLKYLLMGFFLYAILWEMTSQDVLAFLHTPYWKVADLKMLKFFLNPSMLTIEILAVLVIASFFLKSPWCRYLCPYGAVLGLLSLASPLKVKREPQKCTGCHKCTQVCPAYLRVEDMQVVHSVECIGCLDCVSDCPANGALNVAVASKKVQPFVFPLLVAVLLWGSIFLAILTGHWYSKLTLNDYKMLVPMLDYLGH